MFLIPDVDRTMQRRPRSTDQVFALSSKHAFLLYMKKTDLLETYLPVEQTGEKELVHKLMPHRHEHPHF
jgi:hypothetical protein